MRRLILYLLLVLHSWALCSLQSAPVPPYQLLKQADLLFHQRSEEGKMRKAWELYQQAHQIAPESTEGAWKFSMACQSLAARYTRYEQTQINLFRLGAEVAKDAAVRDPDCGPCQFWTAINMAQYGEKVGVIKMLFSLSEIIERLEKAAELDPMHAMAGPHRVLGTIYQVLPGVFGGNNQKAQEFFQKAIELSPNEAVNDLSLAKLFNEQGAHQEAILIAQRGLEKLRLKDISIESKEAENELRQLALVTPKL